MMFASGVEDNILFYEHLPIVVIVFKGRRAGTAFGIKASEKLFYISLGYP